MNVDIRSGRTFKGDEDGVTERKKFRNKSKSEKVKQRNERFPEVLVREKMRRAFGKGKTD